MDLRQKNMCGNRDFDLFSIGRGIKVMGNEVATF